MERWKMFRQNEGESDSDFEYRQLFVKNSKEVGPCPACGKKWLILKYDRRPARRMLRRRCPYCNPMGIM